MSKREFEEILKDMEQRLIGYLTTCADLAAMRVVDTHYKYCEEQRSKKTKTFFAVIGLLLTAAGIVAASV